MTENNLKGVFIIRSTRQLWSIKESLVVRAYTVGKKIRLSSTSFTTEKRRESFFIHGAHQDLTKRDDIRKTIEKYLGEEKVNFGLYQGRRAVSDGQIKIHFRAMLIDVSSDDFDQEYTLLTRAFRKAKEN